MPETHPILSWITYGAFSRDPNGECCVNRAAGLFADGIASRLGEVRVAMAEATSKSMLYQNGRSIYSYRIQSPSVRLCALRPASCFAFQRITAMTANLSALWRTLEGCDIAHINLPAYTGLWAAVICIMRRIPYSIYVGSDWRETGLGRFSSWPVGGAILCRVYERLEVAIARRATFCLAAGCSMASRYSKWNTHTFETAPMVQFNSNPEVSTPHITEGLLRILCVGNVRPEKGTEDLLRAAGKLRREGRNIRVSLVGAVQPEYQRKLKTIESELDLNGVINYYGYLSDETLLQRCYAEADIFVLPTMGEGFPRVLYEAMLSNCPVVASDIPSIRNNLNGSDAALLVPPANPEALAKAISRVADESTLRERMRVKGLDFARSKVCGQAGTQYLELLSRFLPGVFSPS